MPTPQRRTPRRLRPPHPDRRPPHHACEPGLRDCEPVDRAAGFSLVEFIVAMGIFATVLAIVGSAVSLMARDVVLTSNLSTSTDAIRAAFSRLDRQVRYSSEINRPVKVGTTWYVEFRGLDGDGVVTCRQWRLVTTTDTLQQRSWTGTPASAPAWTTVATGVANDPTTQPPFTFVKAGEGAGGAPAPQNQGLKVDLVGRRSAPSSPTLRLSTGIAARNSTPSTTTNADANGDGVSDTEVCREVARS